MSKFTCRKCGTSYTFGELITKQCCLNNIEQLNEQYSSDNDVVNYPPHYTSHPSGIECIQITEHMNFCCGNAIKYIWRADDKGDPIENLKKARWYLDREIARREK